MSGREKIEIIPLEPKVIMRREIMPMKIRRLLRWLIAAKRTPLEVAAAFILGNALGVEAGLNSPAWVTFIVVLVFMGVMAFLADLLRRASR